MNIDIQLDNLLEAYKHYHEVRSTITPCGELATYDWYDWPESLPFDFAPYGQMLREHASEIANSINELRRCISCLTSWARIIGNKNEDEKLDIIIEFVAPIATVTINMPYVIRSRFIYSVAHLSHQANKINQNSWIDDFPLDSEVFFEAADTYSSHWKNYNKLKKSLENISDGKYKSATHDFRNKYHHRFSPLIEIGISGFVTRNKSGDGKVIYNFGYTDPIKLDELLPLLIAQHSKCRVAFEKYQLLIYEQISAINNYMRTKGMERGD